MPGVSAAAGDDCQQENPYGARPGGGISLPEYYKPWPAIKNRNLYLPGTEVLPKNEMRITFLGEHAVSTEPVAERHLDARGAWKRNRPTAEVLF